MNSRRKDVAILLVSMLVIGCAMIYGLLRLFQKMFKE